MLGITDATEVKDLPKRIPKDAARYHFFRFKHSHEGDYLESIGMPPNPFPCWLMSSQSSPPTTNQILRQKINMNILFHSEPM